MSTLTPQQTAERARDAMWAQDATGQALGIAITAIAPGRATATMTVRPDMLNGFAICHGGFITTLADTAMAFASNSYNEVTVASGLEINFLDSGKLNDLLTAEAEEVSRGGRLGLYDVTVRNEAGVQIAVMRGRTSTLQGKPVAAP